MDAHASLYLLTRVVNGVISIAALTVLTHLLGAHEYGQYALGTAAIGIGATVAFQWINVSIVRFHAGHAHRPEAVLGTAATAFASVAVGATILASLLGLGLFMAAEAAPFHHGWVWVVGPGIVSLGWLNFHLHAANARGEPMRYGSMTASRGVIALAVASLLAWSTDSGLVSLVSVTVACLAVTACMGLRWKRNHTPASPTLRSEFLKYGLPLSIIYVSTSVVDLSDRFMIGAWLGVAAVAVYAVAYDLTQQSANALLNVFYLAHFPRVTKAWEGGGAVAAREAMVPLLRSLCFACAAIVSVFTGLSPEISRLLFGPELRDGAATIMPWVVIAVVVGAFRAYFFDIAFHLAKASTSQVKIFAAMAVTNAVLNVMLIPVFGIAGALIATTLALSAGTAGSAWWGRRLGIYPPLASALVKCLVVAAVTGITLRLTATWGPGWPVSMLRCLTGAATFAAAAIALDLGGVRTHSPWTRRRRGP